jgi:thiol-disulfide isomerase/thioredoxin
VQIARLGEIAKVVSGDQGQMQLKRSANQFSSALVFEPQSCLLTRRTLLRVGLTTSIVAVGLSSSGAVRAQELTLDSIVNDPEAPVAGNPKGDVVIVAFLDYNCQYCKKSAPDLDGVVKADGNVRLIYKDCPILTEASVYGARMALAAKYQGAYNLVHAALMHVPGKRNPQTYMDEAIVTSGADIPLLKADLESHGPDIDALIKRNVAQARALGFEGVPNFLIGPFKANGFVDYEGFKSAIAQARALTGKY